MDAIKGCECGFRCESNSAIPPPDPHCSRHTQTAPLAANDIGGGGFDGTADGLDPCEKERYSGVPSATEGGVAEGKAGQSNLFRSEFPALLRLLEKIKQALANWNAMPASHSPPASDVPSEWQSRIVDLIDRWTRKLRGDISGDSGDHCDRNTDNNRVNAAPQKSFSRSPTAPEVSTNSGRTVQLAVGAPATAAQPAGFEPGNRVPVQKGDTYVHRNSTLMGEIALRQKTDPAGAQALQELSDQPVSRWMTGGADDQRNLEEYLEGAQKAGKEGAVTLYNIPHRDLGNYSAGGAGNNDDYRKWSQSMSKTIGDKKVTVYLEPDALRDSTRMSAGEGSERRKLLKETVDRLKTDNPNATVMLAAGSAGWGSPKEVANALNEAGIAQADGFSVGESGFISTEKQMQYGDAIIAELGKLGITGKRYDIETARNGAEIHASGDAAWANPDGAASGAKPTSDQAIIQNPNVRAFVWIKTPWQADGRIAAAGSFVPEYAIDLVKNARSRGTW